jgi:AbrB family looped-hinge helix DNA binding protein
MQEKKRIRWIHILAKGVITLPKKFRDKLGIKDGDVVKGWVEKGKIILEPEQKEVTEGTPLRPNVAKAMLDKQDSAEQAEERKETNGITANASDAEETSERESEEWVTFEKKR